MATNDSVDDDAEECRLAIEAAMGVAMDHCVAEDQVKGSVARLLGIDPDVNTELALREGLGANACENFEDVRKWVLARTLKEIEDNDKTVAEALDEAWFDARLDCDDAGVPI